MATLGAIRSPADLRHLDEDQLDELAADIRRVLIEVVAANGGHLGSNLGAVELTIALHRVLDSPTDAIVWDTGHQAYTHKLLTGRRAWFPTLRRPRGLSGYPNRAESPHDWVENSHASTALSYAYGLAAARGQGVGDALTRAMIDRAREFGAVTVDLTSRPSRDAANRLYQRAGFVRRETNIYRLTLRDGD